MHQFCFIAIAGLALLGGCATAPVDQPSEVQRTLDDGIALYDQGDYGAAIAKLGAAADTATASVALRTQALKYLAFSYCVTNRPAQCRTQFEKAFSINPKFDLEPSEKGHPLWQPVFDRVKKAH
jgi:tetratricopeptide (TPR) repeat protein